MSERKRKHKEYVFVRAYQKKYEYTDKVIGELLGCSARTYNDKVLGWSEFNKLEKRELSKLFGVSEDVLFS